LIHQVKGKNRTYKMKSFRARKRSDSPCKGGKRGRGERQNNATGKRGMPPGEGLEKKGIIRPARSGGDRLGLGLEGSGEAKLKRESSVLSPFARKAIKKRTGYWMSNGSCPKGGKVSEVVELWALLFPRRNKGNS